MAPPGRNGAAQECPALEVLQPIFLDGTRFQAPPLRRCHHHQQQQQQHPPMGPPQQQPPPVGAAFGHAVLAPCRGAHSHAPAELHRLPVDWTLGVRPLRLFNQMQSVVPHFPTCLRELVQQHLRVLFCSNCKGPAPDAARHHIAEEHRQHEHRLQEQQQEQQQQQQRAAMVAAARTADSLMQQMGLGSVLIWQR